MRIADRGLRNRNAELNAAHWNGLRTLPRFRKNLPHACSAIRISPILKSAEAFDLRTTSHRPERTQFGHAGTLPDFFVGGSSRSFLGLHIEDQRDGRPYRR